MTGKKPFIAGQMPNCACRLTRGEFGNFINEEKWRTMSD
jgi:hypothetical protein